MARPLAARSPLAVEQDIARHLRRLQVGRDITVVDTLGAGIRTSLAWCEHADVFFSFWGASLAKYRWVCNKPGLVISSRINLSGGRGDLHIYDAPEFMESPTPLAFVDADAVEDLADAPILVDVGPGNPIYFNFRIDAARVFRHLREVAERALAAGPARH